MQTEVKETSVILVTGGHGFIGSHVAQRLYREGHRIRVADIEARSPFSESICTERAIGNLCDPDFCLRVVQNVDTILHFAATMGGMGTIHADNDFIIYSENHSMTMNLLSAAVQAGVKRFLYASSACVYPESLQGPDNTDVSLRESDVWVNPPPRPQGLYGLEKLNTELLLAQYSGQIEVRIARFHNVYGPRGAWYNGREKVPAAFLRKALAGKFMGTVPFDFEIWGDGTQRRSFLYIEDCVDAVCSLLRSDCTTPVNIGTEKSVTMQALANIALRCVGIESEYARYHYDLNKPVGVASRNSNNDFVSRELCWAPTISLEEGMSRTGKWMEDEMQKWLNGLDHKERQSLLEGFQHSQLVDLQSLAHTFAILLPVTSRGSSSPDNFLDNLRNFAVSLQRTTWRDRHNLGGDRYTVRVYLAIDHDDDYLLGSGGGNRVAVMLRDEGIMNIETVICSFPRGHVCDLWRTLARRAWEDNCDYFVLVGDDVVLLDEGWMRDAVAEFAKMAREEHVPHGIGCVAFTDITFPGMPTFPIIHRTHMDIFKGEVVPEIFVNQDGDPYLYQLYRRWGCSSMFTSRISNRVGGSTQARYHKQHAVDWTFSTLDESTAKVEEWLGKMGSLVQRKLALDVVIPCYRVQLRFLEPILQLKSSNTCSVTFIIIIDDPNSPHTAELERKFAHRPDVRIRVNEKNMGASASRNRGMKESAGEWIHFLDDDVSPQPDLLVEAENSIRAHPKAAGFIGNAQFPSADSIFTAAVHLAGVTYFWDIATKMNEDMPWGVTANLIARRNIKDGVEYDLQFPKTGGGEDIDFCRKKRNFSLANGGEGFRAGPKVVVTHPWWNNGARSYWRFYMWSKGDGGLVKLYPEYTYLDVAPNSAEMLLLSGLLALLGGFQLLITGHLRALAFAGRSVCAVIVANVMHDVYRHLFRDAERTKAMKTTVSGGRWMIAVLESSLIRIASEGGRAIGMLERGEVGLLGKRFDWFTGRAGDGPKTEERKNSGQRFGLVIALMGLVMVMFSK
ncbi:glycosyltransferase family 2 protein [Neolentinus lepideus HHB14362 ss-1]|uniref:Glycosyltransferase family 2 protein n=1 Tax=Neolentinus lepideus HHB14362 ss-1 TaxID=1314782 RepID=A0A165P7W3_9AGAM|nr:glycosyltransferase family 2 protein [Neolentinus lepideus HHB14362 ss-1]